LDGKLLTEISLTKVRKLAEGIEGAEVFVNPAGVVTLNFHRVADEEHPDANMPLATLTNKRFMYESEVPQCMAEFVPFHNHNNTFYSKGDEDHYMIFIFDTLVAQCIKGEWIILPRMKTPEIEGLTPSQVAARITRYLRVICEALGVEVPKAERKKPTGRAKPKEKEHPSDSPLPGVPKLRAIRPLEIPQPIDKPSYDDMDMGLETYDEQDYGL